MPVGPKIGFCSLQGGYRPSNEDAVAVRLIHEWTLCLVADGMGGPGLGDLAANLAIAVFSKQLRETSPDPSPHQIHACLRRAFGNAHEHILNWSVNLRPDRVPRPIRFPVSTLVCWLWHPQHPSAFLAWAGDSRGYRLRQGELRQLTEDQDVRTYLLREGRIGPGDLVRNAMYNYLGCPGREKREIAEVIESDVRTGDRFLLCTDGLSNSIRPPQLAESLGNLTDMRLCAQRLCQQALDLGARDNVSCVVIALDEQP